MLDRPRLTKAAMVVAAQARHPDASITDARVCARNTLSYRTPENGDRYVSLHQTDILRFCEDGRTYIDTGGWNTPTTRDRLSSFSLGRIHAVTRNGVLYINAIPCRQRACVLPDGSVRPDVRETTIKRERALLDRFMRAWRERGVPNADESKGDPWAFAPEHVHRSIMLDWVRSRYVTRRLFVLAHAAAGVTEFGIELFLHQADARAGKLDRLALLRIRRFCAKRLGYA